MKIKLFLSSILFLLFCGAGILHSQTVTFDKYYPQFGSGAFGSSLDIMKNGNYLVGGYIKDSLFISKFDITGKLIMHRRYNTNHDFINKPVLLLQDGNMMAVSSKIRANDMKYLYVLKLASNGDTVWTKTYNFSPFYSDEGLKIFQISSGNFIVFGTQGRNRFSSKKISMTTINDSGEILSTNIINIRSSRTVYGLYLIEKTKDDNFVIVGEQRMLIINSIGEVIVDKVFSSKYIYSMSLTSDGNILMIMSGELIKIDLNGNIISTIKLKREHYSWSTIKELPSGNIVITTMENISEIDPAGNVLWQNKLNGWTYTLAQTSDRGFVLTGEKLLDSGFLWLLKCDSTGFYKSLHLLQPLRGDRLEMHSCLSIKWFSAGIGNVDISYSSDNGVSWEAVGSQIPSTVGNNEFNWRLPDFETDRAKIIISDSEDRSFNDSVSFSVYYDPDPYPGYNFIAGNQIKMFVSNNGDGSHNPLTGGSGFLWPGGFCSNINAVFEDGLVYGGIVEGNVNVNGSTYRHGWQPGIILPDGSPADSTHSSSAIWKINKNWNSLPAGPIKDEYAFNYENWPGKYGAPFNDVDGDGKFTKGTDEPQFIGDEVLYFTSNDLDSEKTTSVYGSPPIGLEFHVTVWAYDTDDFLQDVVFKKYQIINKGNKTIEDMYLNYWCDDDLGDANDDYNGCDSTLSLGFTYNADNDDVTFYGLNPPAVGHLLVQGPTVKAEPADSAKFKGNWRKGYKNLPMTSFVFYIGGSSTYALPETGTLRGAENFYNNMQGLLWNGENYINPNTGEPTKFALSGDPVNGTGWYEGAGWPGGEKHLATKDIHSLPAPLQWLPAIRRR